MGTLRRHRRLSAAVAALVLVVLGAIALEGVPSAKVLDGDDACQAAPAAPAAETGLMPAGLSFEQIGTVTRVRKGRGHVMVQAVTTKPLDEVTVLIQDAVTAAGYRPAGMDNEGFEAEVFFTTGPYAAGQALVRQSGCEGRWDISLVLIDRDAEPSRT
jgi:cell division septation protein DedD